MLYLVSIAMQCVVTAALFGWYLEDGSQVSRLARRLVSVAVPVGFFIRHMLVAIQHKSKSWRSVILMKSVRSMVTMFEVGYWLFQCWLLFFMWRWLRCCNGWSSESLLGAIKVILLMYLIFSTWLTMRFLSLNCKFSKSISVLHRYVKRMFARGQSRECSRISEIKGISRAIANDTCATLADELDCPFKKSPAISSVGDACIELKMTALKKGLKDFFVLYVKILVCVIIGFAAVFQIRDYMMSKEVVPGQHDTQTAREVSTLEGSLDVLRPIAEATIPTCCIVERTEILQGNTREVVKHIIDESRAFLQVELGGMPEDDAARLVSGKNQVMDALLDQLQIPADYGATLVALYRDKSQDVVTRDFAVQHIGHYALALNSRGQYAADSAEARELRSALFDAVTETRTIVAAAAFRALADMSAFDTRIDARRLDSLLVACAADAAAEPAARAMAIHLCGERRVASARSALESLASGSDTPEVLRRSARHSLLEINGKEFAQ